MKSFDLYQELTEYQPFDEVEKERVERVLAFLKLHNNAYDRLNPVGHITGSGFLLNADFSKILLTHHKKLDKWLQFGGHSDVDSNTLDVAARETREESGIENIHLISQGIADVDVHKIPANATIGEPEHYHYDIRFVFSTDNEKFAVSDESNNLQWFTMDEFEQISQGDANLRFLQKWKILRQTVN